MAEMIQLDFFKEDDICRLEAQIEKLKKSQDRIRKGLFARNNELERKYNEIKQEFEDWKRMISRQQDPVELDFKLRCE